MGAAISPAINNLQPASAVGLEQGMSRGRIATAIPGRGIQEIAGQRQTEAASSRLQAQGAGGRPGPGEAAAAGQGDALQRVGAPQPQEGAQTELAIGENTRLEVSPQALNAYQEFQTALREGQEPAAQQPTEGRAEIPPPAPQAALFQSVDAGSLPAAANGSVFNVLA